MYSNIRENWRLYKEYFWDAGELPYDEIQKRHCFNMSEWLIKSSYKDVDSARLSGVYVELQSLFSKTFFSQPNLYDSGKLTKFAQTTLKNPLFIDSPNVKHIYILTRNINKVQEQNKNEFIKKYFSHPKITTLVVRGDESKADALIENKIDFNVFVDDELPNIVDMAAKFSKLPQRLEKKEFIIPKYGYNRNMPNELKLIIESNGGSFTYFNPF